MSFTAIFLVLQSKGAKKWLLAQQKRHVPSFHRQMFCAGFHITVLHYDFWGWKLLGIIPSSYSNGFPPPNASVKSIPSSGNSARIPSADTLPVDQVDLWHHYLIPPHLLSQVDWCLGVLPCAPSLGWTLGSYAPPRHISIIQSGTEFCHNAEKLIMFISASCWGPSAVGDLVQIEQHHMKWNPKNGGENKQTHWFTKACLEMEIQANTNIHICLVFEIHTQRSYKYTVARIAHKQTGSERT